MAEKKDTGSVVDDYILNPIRKVLGSYVPPAGPTELPRLGYTNKWDSDKRDPYEGFRRSTLPKNIPVNIPVYRANERRGGLETLPQSRFDARSPLKSDVQFWHGGKAETTKNNKITNASPEIRQLYAYARLSGAAQRLGLPSISPQQFAAMVLKEGRPDAGFNSFLPQAKPDLDFRKKLDQYNIPEWQKDYLGMINYAKRVSERKNVPFAAVWNGLGTNWKGQTGLDYAKAMKAHEAALANPKNRQFVGFVNRAFQEGVKYGLPTVREKVRDTDPFLKSDPEYKYHNPDGTLKPHGINTWLKPRLREYRNGGLVVSEDNMNNPVIAALNPQAASTTSLDLPPALASILAMPSATPAAPMSAAGPMAAPAAPSPTLGGALGGPPAMQAQPLPSFQEGGMIGPGGTPMPAMPAMQDQTPAQPMDPAQRDQILDQSLSQNPQVVQEIQNVLMQGLQSGEITPQELNMIIQLVQLAAQNPDMYPYVRQFAIQQGIATEEDLPAQYDEGLVVALLTVAKSAQQMIQGGQSMMAPAGVAQPGQMQSMKTGGTVKGSTDSPVPIMAHEGEYVIPKNVVQMKGKEFFDRLVEQYKDKA